MAASSGVVMHDVVTFTVGLLCFLIAGTVFVLQGDKLDEPPAEGKRDLARGTAGNRLLDSERTTKENEARGQGRVASRCRLQPGLSELGIWHRRAHAHPFLIHSVQIRKFERSDLLYWPPRKALGRLVGRVRGATALVADGRR